MLAIVRQTRTQRMKLLVVDDHALIREALRVVLKELRNDATILEATDSREAMQRIAEHPDLELVLLDLRLPDRDGFDVLADLRERHPAMAVVVLSAQHDRASVARALDLGAAGFIPKSAPREVMLGAFNLIFSGGVYIPPEILGRNDPLPMHSATTPPQAVPAMPGRRALAADLGLTERQMDVLALMMQGKSNKAICRALDLAEPTVKNHVTAVLKALKVSNRTEAVIAAGALGLAPGRDPE